jgi:hypothetical protein
MRRTFEVIRASELYRKCKLVPPYKWTEKIILYTGEVAVLHSDRSNYLPVRFENFYDGHSCAGHPISITGDDCLNIPRERIQYE